MPTFLTVWASGAPQPEASSLNPVPGAPPTPNAVTTAINTDGQFDIYNLQGNVQVNADINGYYTDHHHDDRYYTQNQIDDRTTVRSISKPAQSLNANPVLPIISPHYSGLSWANGFAEAASLALHRPSDWTGTNQVILKVLYRRKHHGERRSPLLRTTA